MVADRAKSGFDRWSNDPMVSRLLANMMWCLPEDSRNEATRCWSEMMESFGVEGNLMVLLGRLMRSYPGLGFELHPPGALDPKERITEPSDPPSRSREVAVIQGIKVYLATEAWRSNPSDGGVYVGNGGPGWAGKVKFLV